MKLRNRLRDILEDLVFNFFIFTVVVMAGAFTFGNYLYGILLLCVWFANFIFCVVPLFGGTSDCKSLPNLKLTLKEVEDYRIDFYVSLVLLIIIYVLLYMIL